MAFNEYCIIIFYFNFAEFVEEEGEEKDFDGIKEEERKACEGFWISMVPSVR